MSPPPKAMAGSYQWVKFSLIISKIQLDPASSQEYIPSSEDAAASLGRFNSSTHAPLSYPKPPVSWSRTNVAELELKLWTFTLTLVSGIERCHSLVGACHRLHSPERSESKTKGLLVQDRCLQSKTCPTSPYVTTSFNPQKLLSSEH